MKTDEDLRRELIRIDGSGYGAYKSIRGAGRFDGLPLHVDRVQGDPFAAPSRLRVVLDAPVAQLPELALSTRARRVAAGDWLARRFAAKLPGARQKRGSGKSGDLSIDTPGQQILARTAAIAHPDGRAEARFAAGLPAQGRRVRGRQAAQMLCDDLPALARAALSVSTREVQGLAAHVEAAEDADALRAELPELGLVAFVADGAILPRASGVDDRPMSGDPVPFTSPDSLRVTVELPNRGAVTGMGIPEGVTLIVGGGYHGKSTLLHALARGVWNHAPGDGRELVVTQRDAVKVRAEDGRRVAAVDISGFIGDIPGGRDTSDFSTDDASGSTSQAASICEALEAGASALLMDEDTCATNFLIRDHRMQLLISSDDEPITPFVDRVQALWRDHGVSTVLVLGGSGDYFEVADLVVAMKRFSPEDVTAQARRIAAEHAVARRAEPTAPLELPTERVVKVSSLDPSRGRKDVRVRTRGTDSITFGRDDIDLSAVEQLVATSQLRAIAEALVWARSLADPEPLLPELLDAVEDLVDVDGLDALARGHRGDLAEFRAVDLAAAINRLRSVELE